MARILLGVTGGIAAYKAVHLLRLLREAGHRVRVVPTAAALEFVGAPTWEAISGEPVRTGVFEGAAEVDHVALGREAELVVVAPATANVLARAAAGLSDDLLTATLLTARCPVLLAPAMHTEMWQHPATTANVATLRERGAQVLEPAAGRLTGADSGPGRLPEPEVLAAAALGLLREQDLAGRHVVISAGGTREALDPVRYLGNRSTGRQGIALAEAAAARGARVSLMAASVEEALLPRHPRIVTTAIESATELAAEVRSAGRDADAIIMAAAVADYRPAERLDHKLKKRSDAETRGIELVENPDILASLAGNRPAAGQVIVGFAAETGDSAGSVIEHGRAKARRKGADLLAVNEVGASRGFGDVPNSVTILDAAGEVLASGAGSKADVAHALLDAVAARFHAG